MMLRMNFALKRILNLLPYLLLLLLSACAGPAAVKSADTPDADAELSEITSLEVFCQTRTCRKDVHIRLYHGDEVFDASYDLMPPAIQEWGISIYPGDEFFIEAERDANQLVNLRLVPEVRDESRTLKLKFWQNDDDEGMFLSVYNPFDKPLRYTMGMWLLDDEDGGPRHTSACPVMAGGAVYESWPHAIFQLLLIEPHLLDEDESLSCL